MYDSILKFAEQLTFVAEVKNGHVDSAGKKIILAGMGGSHLAADMLRFANPHLDIFVHNSYGLPDLPHEVLVESVLIASSYSGNTEETLDFLSCSLREGFRPSVITVFRQMQSLTLDFLSCSLREGFRPSVIASGGKLLSLAKAESLPYIQIPDTIIQPRVAVGESFIALLTLLNQVHLLEEMRIVSKTFKPKTLEGEGKRIADMLKNRIPLIYTSLEHHTIAYNWKIKINETARIPVFMNVFPELNHNELAGFMLDTSAPQAPFTLVLLTDDKDDSRVSKRMNITEDLLKEKGIPCIRVPLVGANPLEKAFTSLVLADWTAYHLALAYNLNPDENPAVEEFKKRMKESK